MPNRSVCWPAVALALFVIACGQSGHFIPGESPTVTPSYNPQGTPSAPIVISPDLPEGWRWQYSHDFPSKGDDNWLLLDAESGIAGFIFSTNAGCWYLIGGGEPEPPCIDKDEVGKQAVEILVAKHESRPKPTAAPEPKTPLEAFKLAFEPKDSRFTQPVLQLDDRSFTWTASVAGSGIYQIVECPTDQTTSPTGRCVRGQLVNTTKYAMADVQATCDGVSGNKTPPIKLASVPVKPGDSVSWIWVRDPIVEPYTCRITWAARE